MTRWTVFSALNALLLCSACGAEDSAPGTAAAAGGATGAGAGGEQSGSDTGGQTSGGGAGGGSGAGGSVAAAGGSTSTGGQAPVGDGVAIPGLACGGVLDANLLPPFTQIGGRDVYVDYACGKAKGTKVTFVLNLHGTMAQETGKIYQRAYFGAARHTDTHDLVVATPKSVVSQWGNMDGGVDEPHLLAVIDWVYATFKDLDIREMWVDGHSWGAAYARTFVCKPELNGRIGGVVLMSGGPTVPTCAERLSILGTVGETDIVPGELDQAAVATAHGCAAATKRDLGNNVITEWKDCAPRRVHRDYFQKGKGHGFSPVDWPDEGMTTDMLDAIVSTRP